MKFDFKLDTLESDALSLQYFKVPWDTELLGRNSAQLQKVLIRDSTRSASDFKHYMRWMESKRIEFATAKIPHCNYLASQLVQEFGFKFIELNYKPYLDLAGFKSPSNGELIFEEAQKSDKEELCSHAASIFTATRFHLDPKLGTAIGNKRYRAWMSNAFNLSHQRVFKCLKESELMAFFVMESKDNSKAFWSLVGLSPGLQGKGLGISIWTAALNWLGENGYARIETSISSLNLPVMNLYIRLGFKFPEPDSVFHWHSRTE